LIVVLFYILFVSPDADVFIHVNCIAKCYKSCVESSLVMFYEEHLAAEQTSSCVCTRLCVASEWRGNVTVLCCVARNTWRGEFFVTGRWGSHSMCVVVYIHMNTQSRSTGWGIWSPTWPV